MNNPNSFLSFILFFIRGLILKIIFDIYDPRHNRLDFEIWRKRIDGST